MAPYQHQLQRKAIGRRPAVLPVERLSCRWLKMPVEVTSIDDLSRKIEEKLQQNNSQEEAKLLLLIYGAPGSGKSTYSELLTQALNKKHGTKGEYQKCLHPSLSSKPIVYQGKGKAQTQICQYNNEADLDMGEVPFAIHLKMDGFHLPLSVLDENLRRRRGCQESFDASLVVKLVELLLTDNSWSYLSIPDFDHATKDPVNPGIYVSRKTKVVVLEGLYLMLDIEPWSQIKKLVKDTTNNSKEVRTAVQVAHICGGNETETAHRIGLRHLKSGLVVSYDEGKKRYYDNDLANAEMVETQSSTALDDLVISNSIRLTIP